MTWTCSWGLANDDLEAIEYTWEQMCKPRHERPRGFDAMEARFKKYVDTAYRAFDLMRMMDPYDDPTARDEDRITAHDLFFEWLYDMDTDDMMEEMEAIGWKVTE